jgi:protein TonB
MTSGAAVILMGIGLAAIPAQEPARSAPDLLQVAGAVPKSEPGPLERSAKPITPENPIPRRTHVVVPQYPPEAAAVAAMSAVPLRVTLNGLGRVAEVRATGMPMVGAVKSGTESERRGFTAASEALVRAATQAVRQWLYDPPADAPISFDVVIGFRPDSEPAILFHGSQQGRQAAGLASVPMPTVAAPEPAGPPPSWVQGAVRISGTIKPPTKVKHVNPVYPPEAQQARVSGVVILEARIEPDGRIVNARILRSIPPLDQAALDAVTQWEFTPTLVNGVPTPVLMTVTVSFSLQ